MATPTLTASLDKLSYAPGEKMTLTVTYADADNATVSFTVTGVDSDGNDAVVTVQRRTLDPVTLTVSDPGKTWTKVSDNGSVAVFTATA